MAGIDHTTGRPLDGFAHVAQSIQVIFSTQIGERVMRRHFGSSATTLLGRLLVAPNVLRFFALVSLAIETWEPRFRVTRVIPLTTSPEAVRVGHFSFAIEGEYRPRGHLGDPTPEGIRRVSVSTRERGFIVGASV